MDAREAKQRVLTAGMSQQLLSDFACVSQATIRDGNFKYSERICHALARSIVCRSYAMVIFQLCHLVNTADACGNGNERFEWLFFGNRRAVTRNYKGPIESAFSTRGLRRPGFQISDNGVAIRYTDGIFNIPYSRMPLLCAMLEFLIGIGSYKQVDDIFTEMLEDPSSQSAISRAASALEKLLYHYLDDHLWSGQEQRKFVRILEELEAASTENTIEINDASVLSFWTEHCDAGDDERVDFRTYRTVFEAFMDLVRALDLAEVCMAADKPSPIGVDREAGEIDVENFESMIDQSSEWRSPLAVLTEEPTSQIKLLNKKEVDHVEMLCDCGPLAANLPMSFMRAECFGKVQARLTQGLRRKLGAEGMLQLIACNDAETYRERKKSYIDLRAQIGRVLKAAAYVLLRDGREETDGNTFSLDRKDPVESFNEATAYGSNFDLDDLEETLKGTKRAFRGITRKGFDEEDLDDPEILEGFRVGAGALMALDQHISSFVDLLEGIDRKEQDLGGWFDGDKDVFRLQFNRLYGGQE